LRNKPIQSQQKRSPRSANAVLTLARDIWVTKQTHRGARAGGPGAAMEMKQLAA
jgi:hypothetical protein